EINPRHQAQAVFCIDVRSESFRRHLETVGDYETFGFAGFFTVFIRYQALGGHHEIDQFPVIMKAKNSIREVIRTYHSQLLSRHKAGSTLLHAGHALLHDLKENVVTPYVAVESLGWFYSLPFIGKTLLTAWYQAWAARLRRLFVPAVATTMTVDKLSREDVDEMLAAEQRSIIRRALQERFGDRHLNLSLERLEYLRKKALDEPIGDRPPPKGALTPDEETAFIGSLRAAYRINPGDAFARMERITRIGFTLTEQVFTVETALRMMGLTGNFARLVLLCGHGSTSENNPFEAALDCGACGGNTGKPNARVLAAMANRPLVRDALAKKGLAIPQDTYFVAGQHNTTTDRVELFDLEEIPHTHVNDLLRLTRDMEEAGRRNSRERCRRFPEIAADLPPARAAREVLRRSGDWSQVRPEWGLSGNAAFLVGRRELSRSLDLEGRVFLHSYDYRIDSTGRLLEIILTGPQIVGQWINMEHYFSTVDPEVYGSGSKIYHNVVGRFGVMAGPQSDLRTGLAQQTVWNGERPYHEPMRLLTIIEAPRERIGQIIRRHRQLQHLYHREWVRLVALDPEDRIVYHYHPTAGWTAIPSQRGTPP
ncbi:MAG: putative inorganic carbon transporter subunit DabA, partial [Nitrospirota bacterium]